MHQIEFYMIKILQFGLWSAHFIRIWDFDFWLIIIFHSDLFRLIRIKGFGVLGFWGMQPV